MTDPSSHQIWFSYTDDADRSLPLPAYESFGAAGVDLRANLSGQDADLLLEPGQRALIPTGLRLEMPTHLEAQVRPRSGLALKDGVTVLNSPGTIDSDYRGEIGVILINHGQQAKKISHGDRIAQLVFASVTRVQIQEAAKLGETERGGGGFGSTGMSR